MSGSETKLGASIDLHIEPKAVRHTGRGPCYSARLHRSDGEVIVCSTEPLFAACRELVKHGITGHVRKYRNGMLCAKGDIEQLAGLTVYETKTRGPQLRKYQEHPIVVSRKEQKTAETPAEVPVLPSTTKAAGGEPRNASHGAAITEVTYARLAQRGSCFPTRERQKPSASTMRAYLTFS